MKPLFTPLLLAAVLALAACGQRAEGELLAKARAHLEKNEANEATIEVKNVLQKNPGSAEARFLLGSLLNAAGQPADAEAELVRALEAGYDPDQVLPMLARTLLEQKKHKLLVDKYGDLELKGDDAGAELKTWVGMAHMNLDALGPAEAAVASALKRVPDLLPALVLRARLKLVRGDLPAAQALLDDVLARYPQSATAWLLQGDVFSRGGPEKEPAALEAYRKSLEIRPELVAAHAGVLSLLIGQRDFDGAAKQWAVLKSVQPLQPQTFFFEGVLALQQEQFWRAREVSHMLLRFEPRNPRLLLLAGQAEMRLNSMAQAETLLRKAMLEAPDASPPRRVLAEVYLRMGQADKAMNTLEPLLKSSQTDGEVMALVGQAQLMRGDALAAEISFARAAKLKPDDKRIRTSAALARLTRGQGDADFSELEAIAKADTGTMADMALISTRLKRREFDAALKALDKLAAKEPKLAVADYLRGRIALQRNDGPAARKAFEAALAKEPGYFAATASLAALDVVDGQGDAAKTRFDAVLRLDPNHPQARLALAELAARRGASSAEVTKSLVDTVQANAADPGAHLALIDHLVKSNQTTQALAAAQAGLAALPDNADLMDRLGRLQLQMNEHVLALGTFTNLVMLQPNTARARLGLAEALLANNDPGAAWISVRRAIDTEPASVPAARAGVALALRTGKPDQALGMARRLQSTVPFDSAGYLLEGEVELSRQQLDAAAAAFTKALARNNPAEAVQRLHTTLLRAGKPDEAQRVAETWLKDHPRDTGMLFHLGDAAVAQNRLAEAEQRYRQVLAVQPKNVQALNNVAYMLAKQDKPGAVALAEQAVQLAPTSAALLDTLATSYAQEKQLGKAVEAQSRAVALSPDAPQYRLSLARLQIQAGNKAAARTELDKLAQLGSGYSAQAEVARLIKQLGT
jgi:putative PEP-CTERM system TPR-repeat lipoprotein